MAEGKRRLFNRSTVTKAYSDLLERIKNIPNSDLLLRIDYIIAFGSYVNTGLNKIHDLDVCFVYTRNPNNDLKSYEKEMKKRILSKRPNSFNSFFDCLIYDYIEACRYLRGTSNIISVHGPETLEIALSNKYVVIWKDGQLTNEALMLLEQNKKVPNDKEENM